jgi:hypothetical protein
MNSKSEFQNQMLELIELFESVKHDLQNKPPVGRDDLNFAGVTLLNYDQHDPNEDSFIRKRLVRTDMPHIYTWLFRHFVPILSTLPGYGYVKEDLFGRLGNTIVMAEIAEPPLTPNEKIAALFADVFEVGQDLIDGNFNHSPIAFNGSVTDDWVTRSLASEFVDLETFETELFGGTK